MMGAAAAAFACCVRRTRWKAHWHPLCCTPWACLPRRYGCCGTQIRWHAVCPSWRHSQMQGYVLCGSVDRLHLLLCFAFAFIALRLLFFCGCGPFAGVSHTGTLNNNCIAREGHLRKAVCIAR